MSKPEYRARKGAPINDRDAQKIGNTLAKLEERYDHLTPELVVERASYKTNPLHDYFEWDDEDAATKWRLHKARMMMGWVVTVEYEATVEGGDEEIRAFVHVHDKDDGPIYVSLNTALENDDYRAQIINEAMRRAKSWANTYRAYLELQPIVKIIDASVEKAEA